MEARPSHYQAKYRHDLSPQQERVLRLISAGKTNAEIADDLDLSLDGVKWHVREILAKLEVDSREEAAAWWREYSGIRAVAARRIRAIAAPGILKVGAAAGGVAVVVTAAAVAAFAFRGGPSEPPTASANDCALRDLRWETNVEAGADATRVRLSVSLRDEAWYEDVARVVGIGPEPVASPCRISGEVSVEIFRVSELARNSEDKPGPARLESASTVVGNAAQFPVDLELRTGEAMPVLVAELSNWCESNSKLVIDMRFPATLRADSTSSTVGLPELTPCLDSSTPAVLSLSAIP